MACGRDFISTLRKLPLVLAGLKLTTHLVGLHTSMYLCIYVGLYAHISIRCTYMSKCACMHGFVVMPRTFFQLSVQTCQVPNTNLSSGRPPYQCKTPLGPGLSSNPLNSHSVLRRGFLCLVAVFHGGKKVTRFIRLLLYMRPAPQRSTVGR